MDAIIYIRWSSAIQSRGSSLIRQREDCARHAASMGWNVVDVLVDDGVSAFTGANLVAGKLATFVADAQAGAWPDGVVLLTERLDRLSRRGWDELYMWMKQVVAAGVTIATVDGGRLYRPGSPFGLTDVMEIIIKAELAHDESAKKASRLAAAWAAKRAKLDAGECAVLTSRAPAWVRVAGDPPRFELIEERAAVVRRIFADTAAGLGKAAIARDLNREGVPTFGRASGWHASYVQKLLRSPAVLGEFQAGRKARGARRQVVGDVIAGYFPPVVDADLHANALASMSRRSRLVVGRGRRLVNLFAGLATCEACGSKMTFRAKGRKQRAGGEWVQEDYLICDSYQRGRGCAVGHHFNYALWEDGVLDALLVDALGDRHFSSAGEVRAIEIELAELSRSSEVTVQRRDAALALFLETQRPEVKVAWMDLTASADADVAALSDLRSRLIQARGAVSPDEHIHRIKILRSKRDDPDETVRLSTRSTIMAALHDLVVSMRFCVLPLSVEVETTLEQTVVVQWEDHGMAWTAFDAPA